VARLLPSDAGRSSIPVAAAGSAAPSRRCPVDPDRDRDPSGDYGYDLAHEDTAARREADETTASEHPKPEPVRPHDTVGDYGYDEVHGF
jgi:hypothetical protein